MRTSETILATLLRGQDFSPQVKLCLVSKMLFSGIANAKSEQAMACFLALFRLFKYSLGPSILITVFFLC